MTRTIHVLLVALVIAGCGNKQGETSGAAPVTAATAGLGGAAGWWEVPDVPEGDDIRGGAMKIAANELVAMTKGGENVFVRACASTVAGTSVTINGCGPALTGTLEGDKLVFPQFTATRAAPARAAELDKLAAAKRPPADICARALRCLRAYEGKEDPKEEAFQLAGPPHDPTACEGYLKGMQMLKDEGQLPKPWPADCD